MAFRWPLKAHVTRPGKEEMIGYDDLGNEEWEISPPVDVAVFAASIIRTEKTELGGHPRLVERLEVQAPPGVLDEASTIEFRGEEWQADGRAEDVTENSFWNPGLVTHYYEKIS